MGSFASHPAFATFLPLPFLRRAIPCRIRRPSRTQCTAAKSSPSIAGVIGTRTPYDLVHFRRSRFAAHLNELRRRGILPSNAAVDQASRLDRALRAAGQAHEKRIIAHVRSLIPDAELCEIPFGHPDRYALTEAAIRQGKPLIQGAALRDDLFAGYSDLLIHASVDPFSTGAGYAVCEIKLASLETADFTLQVATYATILNRLQNRLGLPTSTYSYLWLGSPESPPKKLEFRTLSHFFRRVGEEYRVFLRSFTPSPVPAPDGPLDKLIPWKTYASQVLEDADSLRLIAGIRRSQAREIEAVTGAATLREYAEYDSSKIDSLVRSRILAPVHRRLHMQARLQHATRISGNMAFEKLDEIPKGMPAPATGDLFFDIEGFPLIDGGLEYLFGVSGETSFHSWWAHTRREEEKAFVQLMTFFRRLLDVMENHNQPHVFHYGNYEVTALQRVAMRVTSVEGIEAAQIFERLLERGFFFDVYDFVRTCLVVGGSSYSIKQIEKLVGVSRAGDELADGESSVGMYYEWRSIASPEPGIELDYDSNESHPILDEILRYNRQDCESLREVVTWLRDHFPLLPSINLEETSTDASVEETGEKEGEDEIMPGACGRTREHKIADSAVITRSAELGVQLHHQPTASLQPYAKQSLSHLLQFHVRESLPVRYAFRRRVEAACSFVQEDLFQDDKCLIGVRLLRESVEGSPGKRKKLYSYSFDGRQPISLTDGESVAFVVPTTDLSVKADSNGSVNVFMTVKGLSRSKVGTGEIVLAGGRGEDFHPPTFGTLISTEDLKVCAAPLRDSILRKSEKMAVDEEGEYPSLPSAFLNRITLDKDNENSVCVQTLSAGTPLYENLSLFLAAQKHSNVFVIQGPPGSGKTYLSARLIHNLVQTHKKTVAVSSNSHYAIDKLLCGVADVGLQKDVIYKVGRRPVNEDLVSFKANIRDLKIVPVPEEHTQASHSPESETDSGRKGSRRGRSNNAALVGATCYQLAQEQCDGKFDFLFIDEASQVNIANFLSMAGSSKYAVLVGDQQQLEMPIKGSHPDKVSVSCLSYAVGEGISIVRPSRGIFLDKSYRMNPQICSFISESFYDKALHAVDGCSVNRVILSQSRDSLVNTGSGIQFIPSDPFVSDVLNESASAHGKWHRPAEVITLARIVEELLGSQYVTRKMPLSAGRRLDVSDILVVAPYNAQVRALQAALPDGVRVGTVDKFQGQEAPVVLISTCAGDVDGTITRFADDREDYVDTALVDDSFSGMPPQLSTTQRRGLRFALRKNRLNVAISRAECLAIVTGQSRACSRMTLDSYEDVETAALYESLQMIGSGRDQGTQESEFEGSIRNQ